MGTWLDFVILILASFRLTSFIVFDKITDFIRRPFYTTVEEISPDGKAEVFIEKKEMGFDFGLGTIKLSLVHRILVRSRYLFKLLLLSYLLKATSLLSLQLQVTPPLFRPF